MDAALDRSSWTAPRRDGERGCAGGPARPSSPRDRRRRRVRAADAAPTQRRRYRGRTPPRGTRSSSAGASSEIAASSMSLLSRAITAPASLPEVPSNPEWSQPTTSMGPTEPLEIRLQVNGPAHGPPDLLDIGEVATRSGMAASTLRFYERERIIESADRKGLRRQFRPDVLTTLAVVAMCRQARVLARGDQGPPRHGRTTSVEVLRRPEAGRAARPGEAPRHDGRSARPCAALPEPQRFRL